MKQIVLRESIRSFNSKLCLRLCLLRTAALREETKDTYNRVV